MKLFISSDMEGTCGITHWDETDYDKGGRWYDYFRGQMSREVAAACAGAIEGGADSILVKDAHDSARNIIPTELPRGVRLGREWSGGLYSMVDGLQEGFDALAFTGYHSPAYANGNPLAHTMNTTIDEITINGVRASEFLIFSYAAGSLGVPVIFLSGDAALCECARSFIPGIRTVATNEGSGAAVVSIHPDDATAYIKEEMCSAVKKFISDGMKTCFVPMPNSFDVSVRYSTHKKAFRNSLYPAARAIDEKTIGFSAADYREVLRFFKFVL
ncbi:MAG: M55 family metallopeptidase [Treponema sp.]|jgi:D-amino peptidase|nr:M55 family metallopeptidase [Treponema sp.]